MSGQPFREDGRLRLVGRVSAGAALLGAASGWTEVTCIGGSAARQGAGPEGWAGSQAWTSLQKPAEGAGHYGSAPGATV